MICNKCGLQNTPGARFCNACGNAIKQKSNLILCIVAGGFLFFAFFVVAAIIFSSEPGKGSTIQPTAEAKPGPSPTPENWDYSTRTDDMTGKPAKSATVTSTNTVSFDFPYAGAQHAQLTLRKHPRYGNDVILSIEKGQFMPGVSGVQVLVRFDDGPAVKFWAQGAEDNNTTTLFLGGYAKFVAAVRKAKVVRISTPVYHEGSPVFEFDVEGFEEK